MRIQKNIYVQLHKFENLRINYIKLIHNTEFKYNACMSRTLVSYSDKFAL